MARYKYPPEWRTWTPLQRDEWHRLMGRVIREMRSHMAAADRDPQFITRWLDARRAWRGNNP